MPAEGGEDEEVGGEDEEKDENPFESKTSAKKPVAEAKAKCPKCKKMTKMCECK
jgi:hypothetical protein